MIHKYVIPVAAVVAPVYALNYVRTHGDSPSQERAEQVPVGSRVPPDTIIAGSGVIEPVGKTVQVGSPVPGIVEWVIRLDRLRTPVERDEVLFRLDDRTQQAALAVSEAMLRKAEVDLERCGNMPRPEEIAPLEAAVRLAETSVEEKKDQYERGLAVSDSVLAKETKLQRKFAYEAAQASLDSAKAELNLLKAGAWSNDIKVAEAAVDLAKAQVRQAETDLELRVVKAQVPGMLLAVDVNPQEYVAGPEPTLIQLGNMEQVHVRVEIEEHDMPRYRSGLPATGFLPGDDTPYPLEFVGREPVMQPSSTLPADPSQRRDQVVTQVIYRFKSKPDLNKVSVGQQMDVFIRDVSQDAD